MNVCSLPYHEVVVVFYAMRTTNSTEFYVIQEDVAKKFQAEKAEATSKLSCRQNFFLDLPAAAEAEKLPRQLVSGTKGKNLGDTFPTAEERNSLKVKP